MRSCDQLGLPVPPRWQCQRTVLRCLARLRSKHPIQTGPSVSLNRLCKQGGWGEEGGKSPTGHRSRFQTRRNKIIPLSLVHSLLLAGIFFFLISPGAEASAEPGWRRVRACSLPVLHRNEAYGTYWRSSPYRLGTAATTLRVQEAGQELFSEALRRDLHEGQGLRCMRDCAMNLALTGLAPLLLPENPQQQTQDTESSSPPSTPPEQGCEAQPRRAHLEQLALRVSQTPRVCTDKETTCLWFVSGFASGMELSTGRVGCRVLRP